VPDRGGAPRATPGGVEDLAPVHFVGVGGVGMSALASILLDRGLAVSGSDVRDSAVLHALRARGAHVATGHAQANVGAARTLVVSTAIRPGNPEVRAAQSRGIPVLHRAQVLAALMREARGIAVTGTHGKTTTTSMTALLLQRADLDPTFVIGGNVNERGTNAHRGSGEWLVAEADESDGSFLWLAPEIAVITNVEREHVDHYANEEEIRATFLAFAAQVVPDGVVIASAEDPGTVWLRERLERPVVTFGLRAGDWTAERTPTPGGQVLAVRYRDTALGDVPLAMPGAHNAVNALAALAAADAAGIAFDTVAGALAEFRGPERRFQTKGEVAGITVIDDYSHHPTEVRAALATARESGRRVIAVFQPHLYSRTAAFAGELGAALSEADLSVVTDVYGAREDPVPGVSGKLVADGVIAAAPRSRVAYLPRRGDIVPFVAVRARPGDLVLTIGAGDVTMLGEEIVRALRERHG